MFDLHWKDNRWTWVIINVGRLPYVKVFRKSSDFDHFDEYSRVPLWVFTLENITVNDVRRTPKDRIDVEFAFDWEGFHNQPTSGWLEKLWVLWNAEVPLPACCVVYLSINRKIPLDICRSANTNGNMLEYMQQITFQQLINQRATQQEWDYHCSHWKKDDKFLQRFLLRGFDAIDPDLLQDMLNIWFQPKQLRLSFSPGDMATYGIMFIFSSLKAIRIIRIKAMWARYVHPGDLSLLLQEKAGLINETTLEEMVRCGAELPENYAAVEKIKRERGAVEAAMDAALPKELQDMVVQYVMHR